MCDQVKILDYLIFLLKEEEEKSVGIIGSVRTDSPHGSSPPGSARRGRPASRWPGQFTVYSLQCIVQCTVKCTVYGVPYRVQYNVQFSVYHTVYSTVYSLHSFYIPA